MKTKQNLWSDVSILVVIVLAITAFMRGNAQFWMLTIAFIGWLAFAVYRHLIPFVKQLKYRNEAKKFCKRYEKEKQQKNSFMDIDVSDPVALVLLRHVNHRISAKLQALYPDATWDWCVENPENIVSKGGTGRICIHGIPDYNYAEVSLDQNAKIDCRLLKIVPLASNQPVSEESMEQPQKKEVDPQVWYEKQGKTVLQNLIVDLNSRGHTSLMIEENGSVVIRQADDTPLKRPAFNNLPSKTYWPRLAKIFERDGMTTDITDDGLVLTW